MVLIVYLVSPLVISVVELAARMIQGFGFICESLGKQGGWMGFKTLAKFGLDFLLVLNSQPGLLK